ncbi:MAG: opine dehydrogenase [Parasphingorhabdus sp.]|jgi:opine dehydrogenase
MDNDFEQFTRAVQENKGSVRVAETAQKIDRVCVLGGGLDGRILAALCLAENAAVTLFSAYGAELNDLRKRGGITLRGEGPIGTFQVDQESVPSIQITAELDAAVADADLVILTGPVHKQRTYAMVLADHLRDGQTLLIAPGRTLAAMETNWLLRVGGCQANISVVEMSGLPYWVHSRDGHFDLCKASGVSAACLPSGQPALQSALQKLLPGTTGTLSTLSSSFSDASGAVESVALLLGGSLVAQPAKSIPNGAVPLQENATFHSLLESESSRNLVAQLLSERRKVARKFGVRGLPDDEQWTDMAAGSKKGSGSRPIPNTEHARGMLRCAVTGSLVPLQSAGEMTGTPTPSTDAMINLASAALGHDLASAGRRLNSMGISPGSSDEVRKQVEAMIKGEA